MTLRVLADFHHHALGESLAILFMDRFGGELWYPYGMEWYDQNVWVHERSWHGDAVARQYLEGIWPGVIPVDGQVFMEDPRYPGRPRRGITLDAARDVRWDLVISTLPANDPGLHALARQTGAKFIVQIGNAHQESLITLADGVLSSSTLPDAGYIHPDTWGRVLPYRGKPTVVYHQEFSLHDFRFEPADAEPRTVASFVNCFPEGPSYPEFLTFAKDHEATADFKVYGATGRPSWYTDPEPYRDPFTAGDISLVSEVAAAMRRARIIWHSKHWSDGFGHVIHNAFAVGRPVIGYRRYYADKLAGPLWTPDTSIDLDTVSASQTADRIAELISDDELWTRMATAAAARFRELVDSDKEAVAIADMLL